MRVRGYFKSCVVRTYNKKDGTQGQEIVGMFAVEHERDIIKVTTYHDQQWCEEHGIHTGASGELNAHFGENERTGWYEQVIWGFKTQEQLVKEEAERAAAAEAKRQAMTPQEKTPEMQAAAEQMVAAAQANAEGTDLPF